MKKKRARQTSMQNDVFEFRVNVRIRSCTKSQHDLSNTQAGAALHVFGPFPVADTHIRGSWLWQGPGLAIWRPPDFSGSREIHAITVAAGLPLSTISGTKRG